MIESLDRRMLTKGVAFFIGHAITRLRNERGASAGYSGKLKSFASRIAFESAVLKLTSLQDHRLEVPEEREELLTIFRTASDDAHRAWRDPRWPRLRLPGNPVRELKELVQAMERLKLEATAGLDPAVAA